MDKGTTALEDRLGKHRPIKQAMMQQLLTGSIRSQILHVPVNDGPVLNSGRLPSPLTVEKSRVAHQSLLGNPLLAESMYLLRYIEKMGTGTMDMIRRCAKSDLPEPEFEAGAGFLSRIWRPGDAKERRGSIQDATRGIGTPPDWQLRKPGRLLRELPENHQKIALSKRKQPESVGWQPRR